MADIKQAAKWLREGKRVKIKSWQHVSLGQPDSNRFKKLVLYDHLDAMRPLEYIPYLFDWLSEDWEIVE